MGQRFLFWTIPSLALSGEIISPIVEQISEWAEQLDVGGENRILKHHTELGYRRQ